MMHKINNLQFHSWFRSLLKLMYSSYFFRHLVVDCSFLGLISAYSVCFVRRYLKTEQPSRIIWERNNIKKSTQRIKNMTDFMLSITWWDLFHLRILLFWILWRDILWKWQQTYYWISYTLSPPQQGFQQALWVGGSGPFCQS